MKRERNCSLDLLRIISMLMILTLHYLGKGNALAVQSNMRYIVWFMEIACMISVNLYVLISGYFLIDSKFKIKKFIKLWIEVLFYSITMFIVAIISCKGIPSYGIGATFLPISLKIYWFITVYLLMYLLSPYLNILIKGMNQKSHTLLIAINVFIFSVMVLILPEGALLDITNGYGIIWFIILYLVAAYIRKYLDNFKPKKIYLILIYIFITLICMLSKTIGSNVFSNSTEILTRIDRIYQYNSVLTFISSLCVFFIFKGLNIKGKNISKFIGTVASCTFAVYLIHENVYMRETLYKGIFNSLKYAESGILYFILNYIFFTISVFTACVIIDLVRQKLFKFISSTKLFIKIEKIFDIIVKKVNNLFERVLIRNEKDNI